MSYALSHIPAVPAVRRPPWLVFIFLTAIFFLVYHDVSISKRDSVNPSEDDIVAFVSEGSIVRQIGLLSLGLFAIVSLVLQRGDSKRQVGGFLGWIFLCFVAWAILSAMWTQELGLTSKRLGVVVIFFIAAVAVARRLSAREIVLWTFFSAAFFLTVGILAEVLLGTFHPFSSGYRFAGTVTPNNQGVNCVLLLLSGLAAADMDKYRGTLYRVGAAFGLVFLILTGSRTSFAAAVIAVAVYMAAGSSGWTKLAMAYALGIALCVLFLAFGDATLSGIRNAAMLRRDDAGVDSLNGRIGIWDDVGYYVRQRPILGYGYGAFWTPSRITEISDEEKWGVPNSHCVYLDYLLSLGAVGLVAYTVLLVAGIGRAFRFLKLSRNSTFAFFGAFLTFCTLDGLLESAVGDPSPLMFLTWAVLASLAFSDSSRSLSALTSSAHSVSATRNRLGIVIDKPIQQNESLS